MNRKLLISKEKRTYIKDNGVRKCLYERHTSIQRESESFTQINPLTQKQISKIMVLDDQNPLAKFNDEMDENDKIYSLLENIENLCMTDGYVIDVDMEDVVVKKYYFEKNIVQIHYWVIVYNIYKSGKNVCSEVKVFDPDDRNVVTEVSSRIREELRWQDNYKESSEDVIPVWVFSQEAAGYFFHECIGHILEDDIFRFSGFNIGSTVFKNKIDLYENWEMEGEKDDLGNPVQEKVCLIQNGNIINCLSGRLDISNSCTGNCFTEDPYFEPKARMSNMLIDGVVDNDDILSTVPDAIYIHELSGGELDPYTGEVGLCVRKAYHLVDGETVRTLAPMSLLFNLNNLKYVDIRLVGDKKTTQSLCVKGGAIKRVKYTTPNVIIDWREKCECLTNRNF